MELGLLENAADSLRNGIGFYKKYIKVNNHYEAGYSYLKSSVIFIHHASELILKRVLSDVNELLIVSDIQNEDFLDFYKKILENRNENEKLKISPIFCYLSGESDIQTINYSKMINKFGYICGLSKDEKTFLLDLNKFRNRVMHIGIDKKIDFYQILIAINGTLKIIKKLLQDIEPYYKNEKICLKGISQSIENIIKLSSPLIQESWEVYCSDTFEKIESGLYDLERDENLNDFLQKNNLEVDIECSDFHPATEYKITFKSTTNNKSIILQSINIPEKSVTLFLMNSQDKVCFLFEHKYIEEYDIRTTNFIIFTPPIDRTDDYFWLDLKKEQREKIRFSSDILISKMKTYIKKYVVPKMLDDDKIFNSR